MSKIRVTGIPSITPCSLLSIFPALLLFISKRNASSKQTHRLIQVRPLSACREARGQSARGPPPHGLAPRLLKRPREVCQHSLQATKSPGFGPLGLQQAPFLIPRDEVLHKVTTNGNLCAQNFPAHRQVGANSWEPASGSAGGGDLPARCRGEGTAQCHGP